MYIDVNLEGYETIVKYGYRIDTRSVYPTLIKGIRAKKFRTYYGAMNAALREISVGVSFTE